MTRDTWHMPPDIWHLTCDMWHMVGGEHSLKISAPQLSRFGRDSVLKILNERISEWITEWIYDKDVYRAAPATLGLLISLSFEFLVWNRTMFVCFYKTILQTTVLLHLKCLRDIFSTIWNSWDILSNINGSFLMDLFNLNGGPNILNSFQC